MISTNKGSFSLYISLLALLFIFNGCEDPGSVGSEYVDRPELQYDTLSIDNTQLLNYAGYSGRLSFVPMGSYSDPLFGELTANALFKPLLAPAVSDSIELGDFSMQLQIRLDSLQTYGDTLSSSSFTLYEVTQPWRGRALRLDENLQYDTNPVGTFTIGPEASAATVENLSDTWVDKYKCYYTNCNDLAQIDSVYNYEFGGLIAVPDDGSSKIEFGLASESQFIFISEAETDTVDVPLRDWGYTLERGEQNLPQNTFALHSTLEGMTQITMPLQALKDGTTSRNILRADVVFHEAENDLLNSLPANHQRLRVNGLNLGLVATEDPVYEYQFGTISFFGTMNEEIAAYEINVTNYINNVLFGDESREELVLGIGSATGALRSTVIYDEKAPEHLRPKIIITSLVD
jgi:hypothetical protein